MLKRYPDGSVRDGSQSPRWEPSPEEIAAACAEIRAGWSLKRWQSAIDPRIRRREFALPVIIVPAKAAQLLNLKGV